MKYKDFWIELWSYVTQQDTVLSSKLKAYVLGRQMSKKVLDAIH